MLSLSVLIGGVLLETWQLVLLALPLLFVAYTFAIHSGYSKSNPIVWSWVPHFRSALSFGADPNSFLLRCKQQYGPVFTVNLGGRLMTFITDPAAYPLVAKSREGLSFTVVAAQVGQDVLSQDAAFSADQAVDAEVHQQYAKYLTGQPLDEISQEFLHHLQRWFSDYDQQRASGAGGLDPKAPVGLLDLCTRAIFSASTRALFGELLTDDSTKPEWGPQFSDAFFKPSTLMKAFHSFDAIFPLLYGGVPKMFLKDGVAARDAMIRSLAAIRPGAPEFMHARRALMVDSPPESSTYTDRERNFGASQLGSLWALQGNTIPASFWTIWHLLQNPADMQRVQQQVQAIVRAENEGEEQQTGNKWQFKLSREGLKQMTLLDGAINEALRLATGSMMMRRATSDVTLDLPTGPLPLKAGASVAVYPWISHHDESIFPNPEKFDLDRWEGRQADSSLVTNARGEKVAAFMPFGAGISMCPGRHFARAEIKMLVAVVLAGYSFALPAGQTWRHPGYLLSRAGLGIFPPASDVQVVVQDKQ